MDVAHAIAKRFKLPEERIVHVRDRAFNDQRCARASSRPPPCAPVSGCMLIA